MQKWQIFAKDFAKERLEYPFLAITANANAQCERTLNVTRYFLTWRDEVVLCFGAVNLSRPSGCWPCTPHNLSLHPPDTGPVEP